MLPIDPDGSHFYFSLLTSHFSLLTSHFSRASRLTRRSHPQLFEIQHAAMETIDLADEIQKAATDALEANRAQSARIVTARTAVFQATRALLLAPITTRDVASRRAAARNIHGIVSQLSVDEQSLSGTEAALLRGKFEVAPSHTRTGRDVPARTSGDQLWEPQSHKNSSSGAVSGAPCARRDAVAAVRGFMAPQRASIDAQRPDAPMADQACSRADPPRSSSHAATRASAPSLQGSSCTFGGACACSGTPSCDRSTAGSIPGSPLEAWMEAERRRGVAHHQDHELTSTLFSDVDVELPADTLPFDLQDEDLCL